MLNIIGHNFALTLSRSIHIYICIRKVDCSKNMKIDFSLQIILDKL